MAVVVAIALSFVVLVVVAAVAGAFVGVEARASG